MSPRRTVLLLASGLAVVVAGLVTPATVSAAQPATVFTNHQGLYQPVAPTRIMDTRTGLGGSSHLGPAHTATLQVTGTSAVPSSGAEAVVFNLTVVGPTSSGFVTAWPTGQTRPNTSSINYQRSWIGANLVTVKLGTGGKVSFYNSTGTTDIIVDVVGWYADATNTTVLPQFFPATPNRTWDSRPTSHLPGKHVPIGGLGALVEPVDIDASVNGHITALVVTLTALNEQTTGHFTAWSGSGAAPTTSVLNYTARTTVANLAIVPTIPCPSNVCEAPEVGLPSFKVLNGSNGSSDILIDVWGYYDDGTLANGKRFEPLDAPIRIVDTRKQLTGLTTLGTGSTRTEIAPSTVAGDDTQLLVQNVTSIPAANTFLTFWRTGDPKPPVSNIQARAGHTVAGLAYTMVGTQNDFSFYNANGRNDVLVDVAGSMENVS